MKWNFRKMNEYAAVSEEEYSLDQPIFKVDLEKIQIYLDGNKMEGEVSVTMNVDSFVYVTIRPDKKMHYYIECDGYLYELFGTTVRKALDELTKNTHRRTGFDALKVGDNLAYSWGKEWYLIAPLDREG